MQKRKKKGCCLYFCNDGNNFYIADFIFLCYHSWLRDCVGALTASRSLQIVALVSRVSLSSMLLEVELSVAFALFS
jgi:hypothetical protein